MTNVFKLKKIKKKIFELFPLLDPNIFRNENLNEKNSEKSQQKVFQFLFGLLISQFWFFSGLRGKRKKNFEKISSEKNLTLFFRIEGMHSFL